MRTTYIFYLTFLSFTTASFAQLDTIYFDANWNTCTKNQASYFRPPPAVKNSGFWIIDYYATGNKQMEAFSEKAAEDVFDGLVTYYFENGNVQQTVNFKNHQLHGPRKDYYPSGRLKDHSIYVNGQRDGLWVSYHENAQKSETGNYKNDVRHGVWQEYHPNGKLKATGSYKKGKKVGEWTMYYYKGENEKL